MRLAAICSVDLTSGPLAAKRESTEHSNTTVTDPPQHLNKSDSEPPEHLDTTTTTDIQPHDPDLNKDSDDKTDCNTDSDIKYVHECKGAGAASEHSQTEAQNLTLTTTDCTPPSNESIVSLVDLFETRQPDNVIGTGTDHTDRALDCPTVVETGDSDSRTTGTVVPQVVKSPAAETVRVACKSTACGTADLGQYIRDVTGVSRSSQSDVTPPRRCDTQDTATDTDTRQRGCDSWTMTDECGSDSVGLHTNKR